MVELACVSSSALLAVFGALSLGLAVETQATSCFQIQTTGAAVWCSGLVAAWDTAFHCGGAWSATYPASCQCTLGGSRCWLKYLGPCHPYGRPRWTCGLLASAFGE